MSYHEYKEPNIDELIAHYSTMKNMSVKDGDYDRAAACRDHIVELRSQKNKIRQDAKLDFDAEIERMKHMKDDCVKAGEYPQAAEIRDKIDELQKRQAAVEERDWTPRVIEDALNLSAAVKVQREKKKGVWETWIDAYRNRPAVAFVAQGYPQPTQIGIAPDPTPDVPDYPRNYIIEHLEAILYRLSGDISHDNVASAKKMVKNLLNDL